MQHPMRSSAKALCDPFGGQQLGIVSLPVIHGKAMTGKPITAGNCKHGGGIEAAGKKNDCRFHGWNGNKATITVSKSVSYNRASA